MTPSHLDARLKRTLVFPWAPEEATPVLVESMDAERAWVRLAEPADTASVREAFPVPNEWLR